MYQITLSSRNTNFVCYYKKLTRVRTYTFLVSISSIVFRFSCMYVYKLFKVRYIQLVRFPWRYSDIVWSSCIPCSTLTQILHSPPSVKLKTRSINNFYFIRRNVCRNKTLNISGIRTRIRQCPWRVQYRVPV